MTGLGPVSEGDPVKPMPDALSDRPVEPDDAALDELRKAFGVDISTEPVDDVDPTDPAAGPDSSPLEFEIVEQDPAGEPAEPPDAQEPPEAPEPQPAPAPPVVIIDDFDGTVPVDPLIAGAKLAARAAESGDPAVDASGSADRHVISIDADDIPDAVYVEGSLEGDGSRSIVFIEDDVDSDALTPESDRDLRRGIEPRMRERRAAVKRAQGRKRLKWLVAAFVLVIVAVAVLATFGSSLFAIKADQVTVTGNVYTDPERLQAVIDDLVGTPVLVADTQQAERDLEAIPWVDEAKVTTHFPHAAQIDIRERQAMATYQGPDGKFRVLDREGRVLDVLEKYPFAYVLITGPDPVDLEPSEFAPQGYQGAAELAKNLTGTVRGQRREPRGDGERLATRDVARRRIGGAVRRSA